MKEIVFKNTAVILALITGSLYVFGFTFYQGFLNYWGIEETLYPLSFDRTLFQGFEGYTRFWTGIIIYIVLVSVVMYLILIFMFSIRSRISKYHNKLSGTINKNEHSENDDIPNYLKIAQHSFNIIIGVFVVLIMVLILLITAGNLGKKAAEQQKYSFENKSETKVTFAHKTLGEMSGYSIVCSEKRCAYFIEGEMRDFMIDDITMIHIKLVKKQSK